MFNKQRYEFFSKSQLDIKVNYKDARCCSISKDTNFSANHNSMSLPDSFRNGVVQ